MAITAQITSEKNVGEKTFADSLIFPARQNLSLSQNELRIISQVGSKALHELHALGQDTHHPVFKLQHRAGEDRILGAETARTLASATPDLLTAYHFFETRVAPAIDSKFAITSPLSLPRLLSTATSLQRLTASELSEAIQIARSSQPELAREPIWTQLSPKTLNQIVNVQARAYETRMLLQPGGAEVLQQREQGGQDRFVRHMEILNGVMLADKLRTYSKNELLYLRSLGRESASYQIKSLRRDEFCAQRLTVLPTTVGHTISMQQGLLDRLIDTRHSIWEKSREIISTEVPTSSTLRTALGTTRSDPNALANTIRNGSVLAVYTLVTNLAQLSDTDFNSLVDRAEGSDKQYISLEINSTDLTTNERPVEQEITINAEWHPSIVHSELIESSKTAIKQLESALHVADRTALEPYFTSISKASFTIATEQFDEVARSLSQIAKSRTEIINSIALQITSSLSLSTSLSALLDQKPQSATLILPRLLAILPSQLSTELDIRLAAHRSATDQILKSGLAHTKTPSLLHVSECTSESLDKTFSDIRNVIGQRQRSILSTDYASDGGISSDYYDRQFFDRYLTAGGRILIQQDLQDEPNKINGIILFSRPGFIPAEFISINKAMSLASTVSCAELVAVTRTRPPGTYHRLFRMMMAEIALEGGLFSVGFVEQSNSRHKELLEFIAHRAHPLLAITNRVEGQKQNETYIPMVYRIPSANSEAHEPWSFR